MATIILIVQLWGPGVIAAIPIVLSIFCLIPVFISIEKYDNQIEMQVEAQIVEYKTAHGILYREKDPKAYPEVATLLNARWSYGHSPGVPVSLDDLPPPKNLTK